NCPLSLTNRCMLLFDIDTRVNAVKLSAARAYDGISAPIRRAFSIVRWLHACLVSFSLRSRGKKTTLTLVTVVILPGDPDLPFQVPHPSLPLPFRHQGLPAPLADLYPCRLFLWLRRQFPQEGSHQLLTLF